MTRKHYRAFIFVLTLFAVDVYAQTEQRTRTRTPQPRSAPASTADEGATGGLSGAAAQLHTQAVASLLNPNKAIKNFSQVIAAEPGNKSGYAGRGWAYLVKGQFTDAFADFSKVLAIDPADSEALRGRGWAALFVENYARSYLDFNEHLRLTQNRAEGFLGRGLASYFAGNIEAARADFGASMRYAPAFNDAAIYSRNGQLLLASGAGKSASNPATDQRLRADNSIRLDDWKRHRQAINRVKKTMPPGAGLEDTFFAMAVLNYRQIDDSPGLRTVLAAKQQAAGSLDGALQVAPEDVELLMARAKYRATAFVGNNPAGAIDDLGKAIRLRPDAAEAYYQRATVRAASADPESLRLAVADCDKARALIPDDAELPGLCGEIRARLQSAEQREIRQAKYEQMRAQYEGVSWAFLGWMLIAAIDCGQRGLADSKSQLCDTD